MYIGGIRWHSLLPKLQSNVRSDWYWHFSIVITYIYLLTSAHLNIMWYSLPVVYCLTLMEMSYKSQKAGLRKTRFINIGSITFRQKLVNWPSLAQWKKGEKDLSTINQLISWRHYSTWTLLLIRSWTLDIIDIDQSIYLSRLL